MTKLVTGTGPAPGGQPRPLARERIRPLARSPYYAARGIWARMLARAWPAPAPGGPPPIFVIGCGRSGTTLLGSLFARHPAISYLHEPHHLWAAIEPATDFLQLYSRADHHCLLGAGWVTDAARGRFRRLMSAPAGLTLVEKSPANTLRLGYLDALAPAARFVHIVRDGTDVARSIQRMAAVTGRMAFRPALNAWWGVGDAKWSALRRDGIVAGYYPGEVDQLTTDARRGAYEWLLSLREVDAWRERLGPRLAELRYPDLIADPAAALRPVTDALGLSCPAWWLKQAATLVSPASPVKGGRPEPLALPGQMCADFNGLQARFRFAGRAVVAEDTAAGRNG